MKIFKGIPRHPHPFVIDCGCQCMYFIAEFSQTLSVHWLDSVATLGLYTRKNGETSTDICLNPDGGRVEITIFAIFDVFSLPCTRL